MMSVCGTAVHFNKQHTHGISRHDMPGDDVACLGNVFVACCCVLQFSTRVKSVVGHVACRHGVMW